MELKVGMKVKYTLTNDIWIVDKIENKYIFLRLDNPNEYVTIKMDIDHFKTFFTEVKEKTDPIVESVITKYLNRSKVGIEKYGTTLEENNKDNFLNHLQEELFDASLYVEKLMSQQTKSKFEELDRKIYYWFLDKDLIHEKNKFQQYTKFQEEAGELASAIIKKDEKARKDAFGDVLVTLLGLSYQTGDNLIECLEIAYNEIKNRKGKTENGNFIKD